MDRPDPTNVVLNCFDPWHRLVLAQRRRWEGHVEARHPEVDEHFAAVRLAVKAPDIVTFDATHAARENFYRFGALPGHDRLYLKVCVGYDPTNTVGGIITVYPTGTIGRGERQKWP